MTTLQLPWAGKTGPAFAARVVELTQALNKPFDFARWTMNAMAFETGRTFAPDIRNKLSGFTGLIQFGPTQASELGYTLPQLAAMTAVEQLDVVFKYLQRYAARVASQSDLYMTILWPAAAGKDDNLVLWRDGSIQYKQNAGLDPMGKGYVTKGMAAAKVLALDSIGMQPPNVAEVDW
jgi:hypothetical protein